MNGSVSPDPTGQKKVLVINGNPNPESFGSALATAYVSGARRSDAEVKMIAIGNLEFDVNLPRGYKSLPELEPDLQQATDMILWCDHMVWVHPIWWVSLPARMKGFIDRVFLPGVMFKFEKGPFPKQLLKGKTGRIITTADTPGFYYRLFMGSAATKQLKQGTLQFCGVSPVRTTFIAPIKKSSDAFRENWLKKVERLGEKLI